MRITFGPVIMLFLAGSAMASRVISYLVKLVSEAGASDVADLCDQLLASRTTSSCTYKYESVFRGFAAKLSGDEHAILTNSTFVEAIFDDAGVKFISASQSSTGKSTEDSTGQPQNATSWDLLLLKGASSSVQPDAGWSLDRLDQPSLPLDSRYVYTRGGTGINVYVLESGIRKTHVEFQYDPSFGINGTRALHGYSTVLGSEEDDSDDCLGHGTHVAATIGGLRYGVAKNVTLHAVRVTGCDGSGRMSDVVSGLDWVLRNAQQPAVVYLGARGAEAPSAVLDDAVLAVLQAGISVVVGAGNYNQDACQVSPARMPGVMTGAALDINDTRWASSNHGRCVDIYAPGVDVTSAMDTDDLATMTASGTSMAAAHVTGVAALYLQSNTTADPSQVQQMLKSAAVPGAIQTKGDTTDKMLQTWWK